MILIFRQLVAISVLFSIQSAHGGSVGSSAAVNLNSEGAELLKKQNFRGAEEKFAKGLAEAPFSAELQINLGLAFDGGGNIEKAKQAYELAAKAAQSPETGFAANFNLAELAGREKKVDEALAYYQKALQFEPNSMEAKTNIELLTQQQQQKDGGGEDKSDNKDQQDKKDKKEQKDKKDDKDKKDQGKDKDKKDKGDAKDSDKDKDKDQEKDEQGEKKPQEYKKSKPQPQPFKSEELSPGDVKKILEELDRQEQRVRAEFNKKQVKERPRDKDW